MRIIFTSPFGIKLHAAISKLLVLVGLLVLFPLIIILWFPQDSPQATSFIIPGVFSIILGLIYELLHKYYLEEKIRNIDNSFLPHAIVVFAWIWGIIIGAAPFVLSGQLTPVQAAFEAVSGWTTTGLSVLDVSNVSHTFLFHRSFMQFCGGVGFVLMMIMIVSDKQSGSLFSAEGHPDKLMPTIRKTAQAIMVMYSTFLVAGSAAFIFAGMNVFDSINHAMCALSTGGFSTRLESFGYYHSLPIEMICIVLMLIGTTNFAVLLLATRGQWRQVFQVSEFRFMLGLLAVIVPITGWSLSEGLNVSFFHGLRIAFFDIVSALSTSGFSTMSYATWPQLAIAMLIVVMFIGGGIGSTAGGLKIARAYLMLRLGQSYLVKRVSPTRRIMAPSYIKAQGRTLIDNQVAMETTGFFVTYLLLFFIGGFLVTVTSGSTLTEGIFEFASSLGTVGLSIGLTGPDTNNATLLVEMAGMFLGRLEVFIVLLGCIGFIRQTSGLAKVRKIATPQYS